ncbi:MAG: hypothetical protein HZB33_09885 [Nitrospirae bacterium]|nr:hypothetical protein [Nitrospirota bacterium]
MEIPEKTLALLLRHSDPLIAGKAAIGEWAGDPKGKVRDSLKEEWERAILRIYYAESWLGEILKNDPELSFKWLKAHLVREIDYDMLKVYKSAIAALDIDKRKELLKIVPNDTWRGEIVNYLVGDSLELYQTLLGDKSKKDLHFLLLHGFKMDAIGEETWEDESWISKAKMALDAGYAHEDIEDVIFSRWSFSGKESDMWNRWIARYDRLLSNDDPRIQKIGEIGKAKALKNLERALKNERREAIHGYE